MLPFTTIGNPATGYLTTTQATHQLPFAVKRIFWTYGIPDGVVRGEHANKATEEVLVAVAGSINVKTQVGQKVQKFELNDSKTGLYIPTLCWTELQFSEGAVALCLTSTDYDPTDYIRSFEEFLQLSQK